MIKNTAALATAGAAAIAVNNLKTTNRCSALGDEGEHATTEKMENPNKTASGMKPLALKINDVANMLSVSTATIRRLVDRGDLKVIRKLRHVLIPLSEVEAFVAVEGGRKGAQ